MTAHVVLVWGKKGGIGKSRLASNLAYKLGAALPGKVGLVDANASQATSKRIFDGITRAGHVTPTYDVMVEGDPRLLVNAHKLPYEYVVIDGPPAVEQAMPALDVADIIVSPMLCELLASAAVMEGIRDVYSDRNYVVVMSNIPHAKRNEAEHVKTTLGTLGIPHMQTTLRQYLGAYDQSVKRGIPVPHESLDVPNAEKARQDINGVYAELTGRMGWAA